MRRRWKRKKKKKEIQFFLIFFSESGCTSLGFLHRGEGESKKTTKKMVLPEMIMIAIMQF